ncbi:MAG: hypothetical protein RLO52_28960 [Sandaracinaceae bacterium]|mgnify:CR=1 FL=1|nr:hypothetical protein [Myxococcales bacterium]
MKKTQPKRPHVGMSKDDWETWEDVVDTFVLERPPTDPDLAAEVLLVSLDNPRSWGDFVSGEWVTMVPTQIYLWWEPGCGYREGRALALIDRFVRWLHGRGELSRWQIDRLLHAIDDARESVGLPRRTTINAHEWPLAPHELDRFAARFAESLAHPVERDLAPGVVSMLSTHLMYQLGQGRCHPFGSLVPERVAEVFWSPPEESGEEPVEADAAATFFSISAAFYRFLASEGRLEPSQAQYLATTFSRLALSTQAVLGMGPLPRSRFAC